MNKVVVSHQGIKIEYVYPETMTKEQAIAIVKSQLVHTHAVDTSLSQKRSDFHKMKRG